MSSTRGTSGAVVTIELGHTCTVKDHIWSTPSYWPQDPEEATHDWELFIRDVNGADMTHYTEKIHVHLHETFKNPLRVLKEPPFVIKEQGYAGFTVIIQIFFKGVQDGETGRMVQVKHELDIVPSLPHLHNDPERKNVQRETRRVTLQKLTIMNKNQNVIKNVLRGGGKPIESKHKGSSSSQSSSKPHSKNATSSSIGHGSSRHKDGSVKRRSRSGERSEHSKHEKKEKTSSKGSGSRDKDKSKSRESTTTSSATASNSSNRKSKHAEEKKPSVHHTASKEVIKPKPSESFTILFGEPIHKTDSSKKEPLRPPSSAGHRSKEKKESSKSENKKTDQSSKHSSHSDSKKSSEKDRDKERRREKEKLKEKEKEKKRKEEKKAAEKQKKEQEKERKEKEEKERREKERKRKEEEAERQRQKEELERRQREEEEQRKKEELLRRQREEEEKQKREEEARKRREEEEKRKREEEERRKREEEERKKREEEERKKREEEERRKRAEEEKRKREEKEREELDKKRKGGNKRSKGLMAEILKGKVKDEKKVKMEPHSDDDDDSKSAASSDKHKKSKKEKKKKKDKEKKKKKKEKKHSKKTKSDTQHFKAELSVSSDSEANISAKSDSLKPSPPQSPVSYSKHAITTHSKSRSRSPSGSKSPSPTLSRSSSRSPVRWVYDSAKSNPNTKPLYSPSSDPASPELDEKGIQSKKSQDKKDKSKNASSVYSHHLASSSDGEEQSRIGEILSPLKESSEDDDETSVLSRKTDQAKNVSIKHRSSKRKISAVISSDENENVGSPPKVRGPPTYEDDLDIYPVQDEHQDYPPLSDFSNEYIEVLQQVQERISHPRKDDDLEGVVKLIQRTGCFARDGDNLSFDLCLLDKRTVKKITRCLGINVK